MAGALDGITILDFTWFQQGPYATVILSDFGARILKVEAPGHGDPGRGIQQGRADNASPYFIAHDRGKESLTLDLKTEAGREVIRRLVPKVDVLIHNFRPGVMERLGLGYDDMLALNARLIYASGSGYGSSGPKANWPGFDIIGQAMGGLMSVTGEDDGYPTPAGAAIADQLGAITLAYGILAALLARERGGTGQRVDVSLYGSQVALQAWEIDQFSISRKVTPRAGRGHPLIRGIWGCFRTTDGYFTVGGVGEARWPRFCTATGCEALMTDERFRTSADRLANLDELVSLVDEAFARRPNAEWLALWQEHDLIGAPVQTYADIVADEQARVNGYIFTMDHPTLGPVDIVGSPVLLSGTPAIPQGPPPELGQHTEQVLNEFGYSWEEITALREQGIL